VAQAQLNALLNPPPPPLPIQIINGVVTIIKLPFDIVGGIGAQIGRIFQ
jgi:hypothetical protein